MLKCSTQFFLCLIFALTSCQNNSEITPSITSEVAPSFEPTPKPIKEIKLGTIVVPDETLVPEQTSSIDAPVETSVNFQTPPPGKNGKTIESITNELLESFRKRVGPDKPIVLFKPLSQDPKRPPPYSPRFYRTYLSNEKHISNKGETFLLTLKVNIYYGLPDGYGGYGDVGYITRLEDVQAQILAELRLS